MGHGSNPLVMPSFLAELCPLAWHGELAGFSAGSRFPL